MSGESVTPAPAPEAGVKYDIGKLEYDLIPPFALDAMVEILTIGAKKYAPDNWRKVPDAKRRYFAAAMRHLWAWKRGEKADKETGKSHLAHAACCIYFILDMEVQSQYETI